MFTLPPSWCFLGESYQLEYLLNGKNILRSSPSSDRSFGIYAYYLYLVRYLALIRMFKMFKILKTINIQVKIMEEDNFYCQSSLSSHNVDINVHIHVYRNINTCTETSHWYKDVNFSPLLTHLSHSWISISRIRKVFNWIWMHFAVLVSTVVN